MTNPQKHINIYNNPSNSITISSNTNNPIGNPKNNLDQYLEMSFEKENFPTMTAADIKQIFFLMFDKSFNNYEVLVQNINDLASNNDLYNKVKVNQSFYKWYKEFVRASVIYS